MSGFDHAGVSDRGAPSEWLEEQSYRPKHGRNPNARNWSLVQIAGLQLPAGEQVPSAFAVFEDFIGCGLPGFLARVLGQMGKGPDGVPTDRAPKRSPARELIARQLPALHV